MFAGLGTMLGNWGTGVGNWIKNNPEQFAMGLDMAGQAFDPNNVAAGVGTNLAQASLIGKKQEANKAEQRDMFNQLIAALGGVTPAGMPGLNSATHKVGPDGGTLTMDYAGGKPEEGGSALNSLGGLQGLELLLRGTGGVNPL